MTNYANMKKAELINLCESRNLSKKGTVAELVARLVEADKQAENAKADMGKGVGSDRKESFAVNAMRPAIVKANETGNRHAITKQDASDAGVDEERLDQWILWVEELREVTAEYVTAKRNRSSNETERNSLRGRIYPKWRTILKVGEESLFSPKMYLREDDVETLIGFCEDYLATAIGTEQVNATKTKFRKMVETLLGCRIKGCETLPAKDRDLIVTYESAQRSVKKAETALHGDGKNIKGIIADIATAEAAYETLKTALYDLGATEEKVKAMTEGYLKNIKDLKAAKTRSEKAKKEAESVILANKTEYEAVIARIQNERI